MTTIKNIDDWNKLLNEINSDDNNLLFDIANYLDNGFEIDGKIIVEQNKLEAIKIYENASNNGHIDSMIRLADFYSEGYVCKKNIDLAIELYKIGIENGKCIIAQNSDKNCKDFKGKICTTCYLGYFVNPVDGVCKKLNPLCKTSNLQTGTCTSCYNGYNVNPNNGNC